MKKEAGNGPFKNICSDGGSGGREIALDARGPWFIYHQLLPLFSVVGNQNQIMLSMTWFIKEGPCFVLCNKIHYSPNSHTVGSITNKLLKSRGRGGGMVVSVLACCSDDPCSIPADY